MYELIVIGGGPGGCAAALRAAQGGLSVALFEPRQVGGTCLNRGCVPTKALLHGAGPGCDWPALAAEVERVVSTLRAGQEKQLRAAGVELIPYRAVVTGPHTVEAGGAAYEAAHILVAAGSEPALPPIPGLDTPGVVTSDGLLSDLRPLDRLAIIGGGVIGVELACVWAAAGARVTILEAAPRLLPTLERELGQSLAAQLRQDGVEVFTGAGVTGVAPGPAVAFTHRGEAYRLEADAVLVATGRRPATGGLFTGDLLPELERGFLRVDGQFRTSIPSLYAIGDAIGGAIHHIGNIHKYARPEDVPEHTLFVITTDGMENASRRYSARRVKEMIRRQKEKYGWEFLFLGANIDAVETAGHLGIAPDRAVNYHCDSEGTRLNYEVMGQAVSAVRCSAPLDEHWKDAIEEDFRKRQKTGWR